MVGRQGFIGDFGAQGLQGWQMAQFHAIGRACGLAPVRLIAQMGLRHQRDRLSTMTKPDKKQMKSASRLYAVQALFQMESSGQTVEQIRREFESHRFGAIYDGDEMAEGNVDHFRAVVDHAVNFQAIIDQMTDRALVAKWPIDRIDPVIRALFRAAGAELTQMETPPKVSINEYVDVAKAFFPEGKESKFVNAVLDHMAREAKPEAFKT